jgi:non-specific serine/threonine protein kinase
MQITLSLKIARGSVVAFEVEGPMPPHGYRNYFDPDAVNSEIPPTQKSLDYLLQWAEWNDHTVEVGQAVTHYLARPKLETELNLRYYLQANLYPHQREFVRFAVNNADNNLQRARVINADDARLGKSIETLAALTELDIRYKDTGPVLILCPKSTMAQWERYCKDWFQEYQVHIVDGITESRKMLIDMAMVYHSPVIITNYYTARSIDLTQYNWCALIVDEAHALKNRKSQISDRVAPLAKKAKHVFLLSATFVEKSPEDWWSPLHIIDPDTHSSYWRWYGWFVESREGYFARETIGPKNTKLMKDFVAGTIIQRRSDDVVNMPAKIVEPYYVELEPEHMEIYNEYKDKIATLGGALEGLTTLRQIAIHPVVADIPHVPIKTGKLEALAYIVNEIVPPDEQIIVFSSFIYGCTMADTVLNESIIFAGNATDDAITRFQDGQFRVLCATPQKGGIGLNLFNASWVIFLDMPWSTVQIRQAEERVRAIDKQGPVYIYRLIAKNTVDEYVHDKILAKMENVSESQIVKILTQF